MDVTTEHPERLGSDFKWMLQRSIQSVLEVTSSGCCNVASRAFGKLIEMDVTTEHPERLASDFKWMLQPSIQSVLEVTSSGCYNVASRASWK